MDKLKTASDYDFSRMIGKKMSNPYIKNVESLRIIDIYKIADLYDISDHRQFHAMKKIICAGKRGSKSAKQDMIEAVESILNWLEVNGADEQICQTIHNSLQTLKQPTNEAAGGSKPGYTTKYIS